MPHDSNFSAMDGYAAVGAYKVPVTSGRSDMTPVAINACFGWLHQPTASNATDTGVVLCAGVARDASTGYRSFHILAQKLCAAGYPTLRYDYPGAGNSCDPCGSNQWLAWRKSLHAMADWLRRNQGSHRIVLMGLRFGAALAALTAAERTDVSALVMLEPVLRGKSYVTQLMVEARLRGSVVRSREDRAAFDELGMSSEMLRCMGEVDLRKIRLPGTCLTAISSQHPSALLSATVKAWQLGGTRVAQLGFGGLEAFLRPTHLADEPSVDAYSILSWLRAEDAHSVAPSTVEFSRHEYLCLRHANWEEVPLRFGAQTHLFGILCRPNTTYPCNRVVIIGNAGGNPHHGVARFTVEFSRQLAAAGIAALRMDFAGLGDSLDSSGDADEPTQVFGIDRSIDIRAAVDVLEALGYRHFIAAGLCSGAYHALQGTLADQRIGGQLLINLPWFTLLADASGPASATRQSMATLAGRRVRTLLLYSDGDAGLKALQRHFGPLGDDLANEPNVEIAILSGLDHDITSRAMRDRVVAHMIEFLQRHEASQTLVRIEQKSDARPTFRVIDTPHVSTTEPSMTAVEVDPSSTP